MIVTFATVVPTVMVRMTGPAGIVEVRWTVIVCPFVMVPGSAVDAPLLMEYVPAPVMVMVAGAVIPVTVAVDIEVVQTPNVGGETGLGVNTNEGGEVMAAGVVTTAAGVPITRADAVTSDAGRLLPGC